MRLSLFFCLILATSCTAPGTDDGDQPRTMRICGAAGNPAMVQPFEEDGRSQAERDLETIGREPKPAEPEPELQ